jgi:hypothetical protein
MKMKINWGTKIAILYIGFVVMMATLVYLSMHQKIELESKDYYAKELAFQSRIDARNKANSYAETIQYEFKQDVIILSINPLFLTPDFKGEVFFYRASNSDFDKKIPLLFNENGKQSISMATFQKGVYDMEFSWLSHADNYFKKISIHIQ